MKNTIKNKINKDKATLKKKIQQQKNSVNNYYSIKKTKKTKKNIKKRTTNLTKKNHMINGLLYGSLEIKNNKHYTKFNDHMINYQYDIKLNKLSNQVETQLEKQINFKDWILELEMEDKVVLEWSSKENKKIKLPKITHFNFNQHKYRIIWNTENIEYL